MRKTKIYEKPDGYIIEYPVFEKMADAQMETFWPWSEPEVQNDVQDLRVHMDKGDLDALIFDQRLFTQYELEIGSEYWANRIARKFKRPEIQRMAMMFSCVELNSHAPFYNHVNKVLFLDTEEFYSSWRKSSALKKRMKFIGKMCAHKNDLISLAAFVFIEGAVLYSSFAHIKHYQAERYGKNLIKNICHGVNMSVNDELGHAVGGAVLFKTILKEQKLSKSEYSSLSEAVYEIASTVRAHEHEIINERPKVSNFPKSDCRAFVDHRIDECLELLGFEYITGPVKNTVIKDWFYQDTKSARIHDFFATGGAEYNGNWKESRFGNCWGEK